MCGIAGYYNINGAKDYLTSLFLQIEDRGKDASGLAFVHKGVIQHIKTGDKASNLIRTKEYKKFIEGKVDPRIVIAHTRAQTKGPSFNNDNNHPLISELGIAVIHNGIISNDDALFEEFSFERVGQVDSEIILRLLEHYLLQKDDMVWAIQRTISKLRGSVAIAVIDASNPDKLYLAKTSNPINLAYSKSTGNIFFASLSVYLETALSQYRIYHNFFLEKHNDDLVIQTLDSDKGVVISSEGIELFEVEGAPYTPTTVSTPNFRQSSMLPEKTESSANKPIKHAWKKSDLELIDRRERIMEILMDAEDGKGIQISKKMYKKLTKELNMIENTLEIRESKYGSKELAPADL